MFTRETFAVDFNTHLCSPRLCPQDLFCTVAISMDPVPPEISKSRKLAFLKQHAFFFFFLTITLIVFFRASTIRPSTWTVHKRKIKAQFSTFWWQTCLRVDRRASNVGASCESHRQERHSLGFSLWENAWRGGMLDAQQGLGDSCYHPNKQWWGCAEATSEEAEDRSRQRGWGNVK